jgi:hypothetical protein
MFRTFADVQTADMLKLPKPAIEGGKPHVVASEASPELKEYVGTLVERAQRLRSGGVDPRTDNMLKITGDGRKAALDMRLVAPHLQVDAHTKVAKAVDKDLSHMAGDTGHSVYAARFLRPLDPERRQVQRL